MIFYPQEDYMYTRNIQHSIKLSLVLITLLLLAFLSGCQKTDVIAQGAVKSFDQLITQTDLVVIDSSDHNAWILVSPDDDKLLLSKAPQSTEIDLQLSFNLSPFIQAGLDPSLLPGSFKVDDLNNRLLVTADLGDESYNAEKVKTLPQLFSEITRVYRNSVGYHLAMDHFSLTLGSGNMIEWAKNMATNDKDLVFILHAQTFMDAGVNPEAIEGWKFAAVEMMDDNGKKFFMDKLLKPFSLKP
jgi:hypothetical protein